METYDHSVLKRGGAAYLIALGLLNGRRLTPMGIRGLLSASNKVSADEGRRKREAIDWLRSRGLRVRFEENTIGTRKYWVEGDFHAIQRLKALLKKKGQ